MRFSTISHKGRRAATFISIYIVYLIPCEWWIMRFSTISHKGRRAATFISIYVVYLILREWRIMRFLTILHKGRRAAHLYYYLSCIFDVEWMVDHEVFHHLSKGIATGFVKIYGKHFSKNRHTLIKGTSEVPHARKSLLKYTKRAWDKQQAYPEESPYVWQNWVVPPCNSNKHV